MREFFKRLNLRCLAAALGALCIAGCASTERDAQRTVDPTLEVIHQASNLYATDRDLNRLPITVDGFKGQMRLRGEVNTPEQKARAERLLWSVQGVRSVANELKVRNQTRR